MSAKLSLDQALIKAKFHEENNEIAEAQELYKAVLHVFPKNIQAQQRLDILNNSKQKCRSQSLPQETINHLINLYNQGQLAAVIEQAQSLTKQYPQAFILWNILGAANKGLGRVEKASEAFKKVTELNPNYADGFNNLGVTLKDQGKLDEAIDAYKKALLLKPDYAEACNNMGNALKEQSKLDEAIEAYNKALILKPDYVDGYINLGVAFKDQGKLDEAIDAYNKAVLLKPDYAETYNNMGNALQEQGKLDEAIEAYNRALLLKPDHEAARAQKLHQQAHICDWNSIDKDRKLIPRLGTSEKSVNPFPMLSLEDAPESHHLRSKIYAKDKFPQNPIPLLTKPLKKSKRIRIGYFSADFHEHATMFLILKVLAIHDRQKFKIYAYSYGTEKKDQIRQKLIESVDVFEDVRRMSDKDIALLVQKDKIDIAVDLKGHTKDQRFGIFSFRPAPIQISFLGYPGSTGANFIDYIIADPIVIPKKQLDCYSEKIIYLPNSYQPNDNTRAISSKLSTREDMGLPRNGFVFCCFNNNYKITDVEFDIWMRLLGKVKNSVLWLLKSNKWAEQNLKKEAEKRGIEKDRLVFANLLPQQEHLSRHKHADLFIDTFNVNAHTTTSDALWTGLPVVTKLGQGFASRVAGSLLSAVGMPELITKSNKEYEALIFELATNPEKLNNIKEKLVANRLLKPLFDTELFVTYLEDGYQKAYQNYFEGNSLQNIFVTD